MEMNDGLSVLLSEGKTPTEWRRRINDFMATKGIKTSVAFARLAGLPESTVRDLRRGKYTPKRKKIIAKLERVFGDGAAKTAELPEAPAVSRPKFAPRLEILTAGGKISGLIPWLYWFVFVAGENDRWQLRELLGSQFQDFLNLVRALTNERMRLKVIEEDSQRLQKGRVNSDSNI